MVLFLCWTIFFGQSSTAYCMIHVFIWHTLSSYIKLHLLDLVRCTWIFRDTLKVLMHNTWYVLVKYLIMQFQILWELFYHLYWWYQLKVHNAHAVNFFDFWFLIIFIYLKQLICMQLVKLNLRWDADECLLRVNRVMWIIWMQCKVKWHGLLLGLQRLWYTVVMAKQLIGGVLEHSCMTCWLEL